jgi:hypothetical protein
MALLTITGNTCMTHSRWRKTSPVMTNRTWLKSWNVLTLYEAHWRTRLQYHKISSAMALNTVQSGSEMIVRLMRRLLRQPSKNLPTMAITTAAIDVFMAERVLQPAGSFVAVIA